MNIAITTWGNRISPVFDSANTLTIVQVENLKIIKRVFMDFNPQFITRIVSELHDYKIDIPICGAITDIQSKTIEKSGIRLISFVSGNSDQILVSFLRNPSRITDFLMPGGNPDRRLGIVTK